MTRRRQTPKLDQDTPATPAPDAAFMLPAILDLKAAAALKAQLLSRRGSPMRLNGAAVERLGAQCLQILWAAQLSWAADDHALTIDELSEDFQAALTIFGVKPADLEHQKEVVA